MGHEQKYWWFSFKWSDEEVSQYDINYRELYALGTAAKTWASRLRHKVVLFECDNSSAVIAMQSGTSRNPSLMFLVRELHFVAARGQFHIICRHLPGVKNILADLLSRDQIVKFRELHPSANAEMTPLLRMSHPPLSPKIS